MEFDIKKFFSRLLTAAGVIVCALPVIYICREIYITATTRSSYGAMLDVVVCGIFLRTYCRFGYRLHALPPQVS